MANEDTLVHQAALRLVSPGDAWPDERKLFCGSNAASMPCFLPRKEKINQRFQMKRNILFGTMILLAGPLFAADASPKDEVKAAAKALGNQTNYSWKATVESPNGGGRFNGPTEGKTENGGYTWLSLTMRDDTGRGRAQGRQRRSQDRGRLAIAGGVESGQRRWRVQSEHVPRAPLAKFQDPGGGSRGSGRPGQGTQERRRCLGRRFDRSRRESDACFQAAAGWR